VPILLAHRFELIEYLYLLIGFIAFSFTSSSIYLLNDLIDIPSDRKHPLKRNRPLASGEMHITTGFYLSIFLFCCGIYNFYCFFASCICNRSSNIFSIELAIFKIFEEGSDYWYSCSINFICFAVNCRSSASRCWSLKLAADFRYILFLSLATLKRYLELGLLQKDGRSNSSRGYTIKIDRYCNCQVFP